MLSFRARFRPNKKFGNSTGTVTRSLLESSLASPLHSQRIYNLLDHNLSIASAMGIPYAQKGKSSVGDSKDPLENIGGGTFSPVEAKATSSNSTTTNSNAGGAPLGLVIAAPSGPEIQVVSPSNSNALATPVTTADVSASSASHFTFVAQMAAASAANRVDGDSPSPVVDDSFVRATALISPTKG